jgi:hypothetical protein
LTKKVRTTGISMATRRGSTTRKLQTTRVCRRGYGLDVYLGCKGRLGEVGFPTSGATVMFLLSNFPELDLMECVESVEDE